MMDRAYLWTSRLAVTFACLLAGGLAHAERPAVEAEPAVAGTQALLGCWDMVVDLPLGKKRGKLCFESQGGELTARVFIKKWREAIEVSADADHVEVVLEASIGQATISADYTSTQMTGSVQARVGRRAFSAQRSGG
ncbi:hypothetical protein [Plesiocystis pacifica]|uniref:hypothetical protein n=1 Tax=Plesiocystis pacifica TaxID=191768 RepID=UPI0012FBE0C3|nr:hypothetical protein [Plesiocystis pacifica]